MSDIGDELIRGLRDLTDKLKAGVPIEATRVTVEHTPDGTLTTREKIVLNVPQSPLVDDE